MDMNIPQRPFMRRGNALQPRLCLQESDIKNGFPRGRSSQQKLQGQCCFPRTGSALNKVNFVAHETAMEDCVQSCDAGGSELSGVECRCIFTLMVHVSLKKADERHHADKS